MDSKTRLPMRLNCTKIVTKNKLDDFQPTKRYKVLFIPDTIGYSRINTI